jgi:hypothetical protein
VGRLPFGSAETAINQFDGRSLGGICARTLHDVSPFDIIPLRYQRPRSDSQFCPRYAFDRASLFVFRHRTGNDLDGTVLVDIVGNYADKVSSLDEERVASVSGMNLRVSFGNDAVNEGLTFVNCRI